MVAGEVAQIGGARLARAAAARAPRARTAPGQWEAYIFLLPWFGGLFVITAGPLLSSLYLSFTNFDLLEAPRWVGLANYVTLFTGDPRYLNALRVTCTYVLLGVPLHLTFALAVALLLNRQVAALGWFRALYYIPSLLGGSVAVAVMWRQMFGDSGPLNEILGLFGAPSTDWIATPGYALSSLVLLHVWQFGSAMLIFLAGLKQVPQELYEAARIDGASALRQFRHVTLPMLTPVIFFNLVLGIINSFQAFTSAYIVSGGKGGPADSTLFYTLYLYQEGFTNFHMGYASAMAWVLLLIIGAFTAGNFIISRRWVFYGD